MRGRKRTYSGQVKFVKAAGSFANNARRAVYAAGMGSGFAGLRSAFRTRRNRMTSGQGVTFENDRTRIYRRKRAPARKRRRWKKILRVNNAVDQTKLGTRTILFNKSQTYGNATAGEHGLAWAALYGANSANSVLNDLRAIWSNEALNQNPTAGGGPTSYNSTKMFFKSAVLDMTIRNVSSVGDDIQAAADVPLELDIYEMSSKCRMVENDAGTALKQWNNIPETFLEALENTFAIDGAGTKCDLNLRGVTPWENTFALSRYKYKIHKKTKYRIGRGNSITYQFRDPKNRTTSHNALGDLAGFNKPGWTHNLLIVYKSVPGYSVGTSPNDIQERIEIGYTRKYTYKVEGHTDARSLYINS